MTFVYLVTNTLNGKRYVGKTEQSIKARWGQHVWAAEKGASEYYFHRAIRKYGAASFDVGPIACFGNDEAASEAERLFILEYQSHDPQKGYNRTLGGDGFKPTQESRAKHKVSCSGRTPWNKGKKLPYVTKQPLSEETKQKISNSLIGKPTPKRSNETCRRLSVALRGRTFSEQSRQRMSDSAKGKVPWNKGKKMPFAKRLRKAA